MVQLIRVWLNCRRFKYHWLYPKLVKDVSLLSEKEKKLLFGSEKTITEKKLLFASGNIQIEKN